MGVPARNLSSSTAAATPVYPLQTARAGMRTREPAHLPLHRRLLFPTLDAERPLPPIVIPTASGSKRDPELEKLNDR